MREAEVVVRAEHDPLLAFDDDDRVLGFRDRIEVRVQARGLKLARARELPALVEEGDCLKLLSIQRALGAEGGLPPHRYVAERFKVVTRHQ